MNINPFTLRFQGPDSQLEEGFSHYFFTHSLPVFRWGFLFGIFLYASFGVLDAIFLPENKEELWKIRFMFVIPVLCGGIIFSYFKNFKRYWQATIAILIICSALGILWMVVIGSNPNKYYYFMGNMLVIFFGLALIRARFTWALATHIFILFMFGVTILLLTECPVSIALSYWFSLVGAFLIGAVANYSMEYFARKNFYLMRRLELEEDRLKKANELLKKQFEELKNAKDEIKILTGLIPICAKCKKVRDDKGYWNQIESYIAEHSDAKFSHALCPECMDELYGHEEWYKMKNNRPEEGHA